jgi:hypothetical protein
MRLLVWHVLEASAKLSVKPFFGSIKPNQWRYCILYDIFSYLRTVYEFKDIEYTESDRIMVMRSLMIGVLEEYQQLTRGITLLLTKILN